MTTGDDRHTIIGLAKVRAPWFADVARWADSGELSAHFRKCVSPAQVREILSSTAGRSVLLADIDAAGVDRSLVAAASERGIPTLLVIDPGRDRTSDVGAVGVLTSDFDQRALRDALREALSETHTTPVPMAAPPPIRHSASEVAGAERRAVDAFCGRLVAVTGGSGCGRSTVAMALAQGLAAVPANVGAVALADFAERGDLAVYHHTGDVMPGLSELVEAQQTGPLTSAQLRTHLYDIERRGYDLLQGRRRTRDWIDIQQRPLEAVVASLRSAFRMVVIDADNDVDGLDETGSMDIERRNLAARVALGASDVTIVCGDASLKGLHALVRAERELADWRDGPSVILRVVNRAPKAPRARSELSAALAALSKQRDDNERRITIAGPIFLPHRAQVEGAHLLVEPLPPQIVEPVTRAVTGLLDRVAARPAGDSEQ